MVKSGNNSSRSKYNQRNNRQGGGGNDYRNVRPQQQQQQQRHQSNGTPAVGGYQRQSRFSNAPPTNAYQSRQPLSAPAVAGDKIQSSTYASRHTPNGMNGNVDKRPMAYQNQNSRFDSVAYGQPPLPKQSYQQYHNNVNGHAAMPIAMYSAPPPVAQYNYPPPVLPVEN